MNVKLVPGEGTKMTEDEKEELKSQLNEKYSEESLLSQDPNTIKNILYGCEDITNQMSVERVVNIDSFLDVIEQSSEFSNMSSNFIAVYNSILSQIEDKEEAGIILTEEEKEQIVQTGVNQASISSVIAAIIETLHLRKMASQLITDVQHYKNLLEWACDEQTKKQLEEIDDASRWAKPPKTVQ